MGRWTRVHEFSKFNIDAAQGDRTATVHSTFAAADLGRYPGEDLCEREETAASA